MVGHNCIDNVLRTYPEYLKSTIWQNLRLKRMKIDNFKCCKCKKPYDLQVHHIHYPEVLGSENVYSDLITLCNVCHKKWEEEKKNYKQNNSKSDLKHTLIEDFIKIHENDDISSGGKIDFCNYEKTRPLLFPFLQQRGIYSDGGLLRVQEHFRNKRAKIILSYYYAGYPPYKVFYETGFSRKMIDKVYQNPAQYEQYIKMEETKYEKT